MKPNASNLRDYYDALHALSEEEQTTLGEAHAEKTAPLARRFRGSVKEVAARHGTPNEPFYDTARAEPPNPPPPADAIPSTIGFAAHLVDRPLCGDALNFRYVDREIFLARTKGGERVAPRKLDLLLVDAADKTPIVAELKRCRDSLPYPALVQLLLHGAELAGGHQLARLQAQYPGVFAERQAGPCVDLYLIYYRAPFAEFRERSFAATKRIAENLIHPTVCGDTIRRIAYVEAIPDANTLRFERAF